MKNQTSIILGPLLGVESDEDFTVCVLLSLENELDKTRIVLQLNGIQHSPALIVPVANYFYFRFELNIPPPASDTSYMYTINYGQTTLPATYGEDSFTFWITGVSSMPNVAFASCSGSHKKYPNPKDITDHKGWEVIRQKKVDLLVLTGDQIYADSLWNKVLWARLSVNLWLFFTSKMKRAIDAFYLQLYIDSWTNSSIAKTLATIPNIMTWDDHDIIDGYGSHPFFFQDSPLFKGIFSIAAKYYELFQLRTNRNKILFNRKYDFSGHFTFRNFTFIIPDTRSGRSRTSILGNYGFHMLDIINENLVLSKYRYYTENKNMNVICFVLPVPIAHRNYNTYIERLFTNISGAILSMLPGIVAITPDDDLVDHWDHENHTEEQVKLLDSIFAFGTKHKPYSILIASGDVHSAGAAVIKNEKYFLCQIISSPISNKPMARIGKWFTERIGYDKNIVGNYMITDFKAFGNSPEVMFIKRNFITVSDSKSLEPGHSSGLIAKLYLDPWDDDYIPRSVNKFVK